MSRRRGAGYVELPEGSLILREFPFIKKSKGAHAEREYRRDGGRSSKE